SPTAGGSPHSVTIRATNSAGFDEESWALTATSAGCPLPGCDSDGVDADLDGNCENTLGDLAILLIHFGAVGPTGDIAGDATVGLVDLAYLLSRFGTICHP
ncbi:MAG: hypothetical protein ACKVS9_09665, partial [Phycisphaerae bacterium]